MSDSDAARGQTFCSQALFEIPLPVSREVYDAARRNSTRSIRSRRCRSNRCPPRDEHGGTKLQGAHACRSVFVHPPEHFQTKSSSLGVHSSPLELITTRVRRLG